MNDIQMHKVTTLPETLEANSLYFVLNGTVAEAYITNQAGVAKSIGNTLFTNNLINEALSNWPGGGGSSSLEVVDTYADLQALVATLSSNTLILVIDASDDPSVDAGSAMYVYVHATESVIKIAEYESMDVVLQWASIQGGPTSSPAQIDDAVSKAHSHANKGVLDSLSDDNGKLRYNGEPIPAEWATKDW